MRGWRLWSLQAALTLVASVLAAAPASAQLRVVTTTEDLASIARFVPSSACFGGTPGLNCTKKAPASPASSA